MTENLPYIVLKPIAYSGRREAGELVYLSKQEAENIGVGEYLRPAEDGEISGKTEDVPETGEYKEDEEETPESTPDVDPKTDENEPETPTGDGSEDNGENSENKPAEGQETASEAGNGTE